MRCPKCLGSDTSLVGSTHYVCNNPNCVMEDGSRTQFRFVPDQKIEFPYNQIFVNRSLQEFYRQPYMEFESTSLSE